MGISYFLFITYNSSLITGEAGGAFFEFFAVGHGGTLLLTLNFKHLDKQSDPIFIIRTFMIEILFF